MLSLLFAGLLTASCKNNDLKKSEKNTISVPVVSIKSSAISVDRNYVSDIQAHRHVEIRAMVSGFLDAIYVDEGHKVTKGQVLFKLNDIELRAEQAKAKAALNTMEAEVQLAKVEYDRVKILTDKNIVSKTELTLAESKLKAAYAKKEEAISVLNNANHQLSYTTIKAPFDGVVDRIPLKVGSLVSEGALVTTVSDISEMYAYFDVSENEYLQYVRNKTKENSKKPTKAALILADGQKYSYEGEVETVVSEFDKHTGSISFRATFPNPERLLKHKATGKVSLITEHENALLIPQKATFEIQDKHYVYVIDRNNVVHAKNFTYKGRYDQYYIIKSGLLEGEQIVYEGIQDLKDGSKVIPNIVDVSSPGTAVR